MGEKLESETKQNRKRGSSVVFQNFLSLSVLQIVVYVFPLITIPYLAQVVGAKHLGEIAFVTAVILYFHFFVEWGYNFTATRDVARASGDTEQISQIYSTVFAAKMLLLLLGLALLTLIIFLVPSFGELSLMLYFRFIAILGWIFFSDWLFQGIEKMKYITYLNVLSATILTISIFIFIKKPSDYIYHPLLSSLSFLFSSLIAFFYLIPKEGIKLKPIKASVVWSSIKNNFDVYINNGFSAAFDNFIILLLGFLSGAIANGIFDAGNKVISIAHRFTMIFSRAFFPFLARHIDKHTFFTRINITFAGLFTLSIFAGAPYIIRILYPEEFWGAVSVLRILSFSVLFTAFVNGYGINYLIQIGREKEMRNITVICSFLGLGISIPLIYLYSWSGAAWAITCTKFVQAIWVTQRASLIKKYGN